MNPPNDELISKTDSLLRANKNVPFVKRILDASKYPVRNNVGGGESSHLMRHEMDEFGNWHVFPMLKYQDGQFREFDNWEEAFNDALNSGNTINLGDDASMAEEFAKGNNTWKAWLNDSKGTTGNDLTTDSINTGKKPIVRQRRLKRFTPVENIRARYKSFRKKIR
jgi:hypothetical protein